MVEVVVAMAEDVLANNVVDVVSEEIILLGIVMHLVTSLKVAL